MPVAEKIERCSISDISIITNLSNNAIDFALWRKLRTAGSVTYKNYPDGLSGDPLCFTMDGPLLICDTAHMTYVKKFASEYGITEAAVLGSKELISLFDAKIREVSCIS